MARATSQSVSMDWVSFFAAEHILRALLFGVCIRGPGFWKLPFGAEEGFSGRLLLRARILLMFAYERPYVIPMWPLL